MVRSCASNGPDHPYLAGFACGKVNRDTDNVNSPERILTPLKRAGPKGTDRFAPISWDDALDEIAAKWRAIIKEVVACALGLCLLRAPGPAGCGLVGGFLPCARLSRLQADGGDTCCESRASQSDRWRRRSQDVVHSDR
jgi:anaerobic selenocysteine-containing dehydrogenase